ncbi:Cadherin EGF LAG seven-pass G-type receptor 2 [Homalodisca vitripennis]|nr:Cadherin EGF LAG seven-pass G-type receptor 2 [Homalodisca vitripennis]
MAGCSRTLRDSEIDLVISSDCDDSSECSDVRELCEVVGGIEDVVRSDHSGRGSDGEPDNDLHQENHYQPEGSEECLACDCYTTGSFDSSCDSATGQCNCRNGVIGRACDSCPNPYAEVTLRGCEVVYDGCPRSYAHMWWPRTPFGHEALEPCPHGSQGRASRLCDSVSGTWLAPDIFNCTSDAFMDLRKLLGQLETNDVSVTTFVAVGTGSALSRAANITRGLYGADILITEQLLERLIDHETTQTGLNLTHSQDKDYVANLVHAASAILSPDTSRIWSRVHELTSETAGDLMASVQTYMDVLSSSQHDTYTDPFETVAPNLDTCFKHQLSLSRIASENDPTIYSTWRRRGANFNNDKLPATTNTTAKDQNLEITESQAFIKAAMEEQKNAWRQAEEVLLKSFAEFYKANTLNKGPLSLSIQALETKIAASKIAYDVIDLNTGQPLLRLNPTKQYCYGFDGTRFIKLTYNNSKYTVDANTRPANKIILVSGETEVMNQLGLYGGIKNVDIDKNTDIKLQLVQGVPGCGKTTFIINNHSKNDLVLFPTREGANDFRNRLKLKQNTQAHNNKHIKDSCRTVHSFIINLTDHIKKGGRYNRLIIDEALMLHAEEILFACAIAGVKEALLVGDKQQIPFINTTNYNMTYYDITRVAEVTQVLSFSYRCTNSVTTLLASYYEQGMVTCNPVKNETSLKYLEDIKELRLDKDLYEVLVFKQAEKRALNNLGFNVSTVHEFQGKQAGHVAVIRTSRKKEDIYDSLPHCIVAISRHTQSFTYFTPTGDDTLSKWIRLMNSHASRDLADHFQPPHTENTSIPQQAELKKTHPQTLLIQNPLRLPSPPLTSRKENTSPTMNLKEPEESHSKVCNTTLPPHPTSPFQTNSSNNIIVLPEIHKHDDGSNQSFQSS